MPFQRAIASGVPQLRCPCFLAHFGDPRGPRGGGRHGGARPPPGPGSPRRRRFRGRARSRRAGRDRAAGPLVTELRLPRLGDDRGERSGRRGPHLGGSRPSFVSSRRCRSRPDALGCSRTIATCWPARTAASPRTCSRAGSSSPMSTLVSRTPACASSSPRRTTPPSCVPRAAPRHARKRRDGAGLRPLGWSEGPRVRSAVQQPIRPGTPEAAAAGRRGAGGARCRSRRGDGFQTIS